MKQTFENNAKTCLSHLVVIKYCVKGTKFFPFFLNVGRNQSNVSPLHLQRYKNRANIELRSIADHCACTTAWSQLSLSDWLVRTGNVLTFKVVHSPVWSAPGWSKTRTCERGLTEWMGGSSEVKTVVISSYNLLKIVTSCTLAIYFLQ